MKINKIDIQNEGYVYCQSCFYHAHDGLSADVKYSFSKGINKLYGEVDSGVWAISYMLSMYCYKPKDFVLFNDTQVFVNDMLMTLEDFQKFSCYMDKSYPLFSKNSSIRKLIAKGIKINKLNYSPDEIRDMFCINHNRFERTLKTVGNEMFKCMAAIAYSYNKQVYCFPWLSQHRFQNYHQNITELLEILNRLDKIVIIPIGEK